MTTITATTSPLQVQSSSWPRVAGYLYAGAWVLGLTLFGAGPAADATSAEVAQYFADHRLATGMQGVLIHGIAAAALGFVLAAVARAGAVGWSSHVAGLAGVALSLTQCALDIWRSALSTGSTTTTLVEVIDRVDGVKMLAFAVMIAAAIPGLRAAGLLGRRMRIVGVAAALSLVVSGFAYGAAIDGLLMSAASSLILLLVWVLNLGIATSRRFV